MTYGRNLSNLFSHHVAVYQDEASKHWLAVCRECKPTLPIPFGTDAEGKRLAHQWQLEHEGRR